ncbi:MAG: hypothetical protein EOO04_31915 [Chitinophagaceae bacterium]|nr:MAG: hypothetical protein EOO04_31915 [Chitinophagaceae bacterium]
MIQEPLEPTGEEPDESDISAEERALLDAAGEDDEERGLHRAALDDTDEDGELLNEVTSASDKSGRDLDVPGSSDDDDMEDIGEEDEENNSYSQADTE